MPHANDFYNRVPVRAVVNGEREIGNNVKESVSIQYDFFDFVMNRTNYDELIVRYFIIFYSLKYF